MKINRSSSSSSRCHRKSCGDATGEHSWHLALHVRLAWLDAVSSSSSSSSSPSCKKFHPLQLYLQQHQQQRQQERLRHRSRTMTLSLSTFVLLWTGAFCWVAPRRSLTQALLPRRSTTSTPTTPTSTTTAQFTSSSSTTYNSASAPHYQQHHYQQQTLLLDGLFPNNVARAHDVASAVRAVQQACAVTVALQPFDHDVYLEATTNATSSNANTTFTKHDDDDAQGRCVTFDSG